jgi:hypothetical protein
MKGFDAEFCAWDSWAMADYPAAYFKCALLMDTLSQSSVDHGASAEDLHAAAAMTSIGGIGAGEPGERAAVFFLATDNIGVRPLAKAALGHRVHYFEQEVTRKINVGHATALIDMFLLALSDDIITTSMSTFGYVAAGLASLPPVLLSFQAQCARELTSQPCFHKWMYVKHGSCYNRTSMISPGLCNLLFLSKFLPYCSSINLSSLRYPILRPPVPSPSTFRRCLVAASLNDIWKQHGRTISCHGDRLASVKVNSRVIGHSSMLILLMDTGAVGNMNTHLRHTCGKMFLIHFWVENKNEYASLPVLWNSPATLFSEIICKYMSIYL